LLKLVALRLNQQYHLTPTFQTVQGNQLIGTPDSGGERAIASGGACLLESGRVMKAVQQESP
jgi:hypothetical protein